MENDGHLPEPKLPLESPLADAWPQKLRTLANTLSISRAIGGVVTGLVVAQSDYPTNEWLTPAVVGALSATDIVDGKLARKAQSMDGVTSIFGAQADQLSDKFFTTSLTVGLVAANLSNGNTLQSVAIGTAGAVMLLRDGYVTYKRQAVERAKRAGLLEADVSTAAKMHGKVKAAVLMTALNVSVSPLVESPPVHWAATTLLGTASMLAVISGWKYRNAFNAARQIR